MKKYIALFLMIIMMISLTACESKTDDTPAADPTPASEPEPTPEQTKEDDSGKSDSSKSESDDQFKYLPELIGHYEVSEELKNDEPVEGSFASLDVYEDGSAVVKALNGKSFEYKVWFSSFKDANSETLYEFELDGSSLSFKVAGNYYIIFEKTSDTPEK